MKRYQNLLLIIAVLALVALPLWTVKQPAPGPDGQQAESFAGADGQAQELIGKLVPDYQPWASSLLEPPSGEIESLLFTLQAALGAGFIGYYLGAAKTRAKYEKAISKAARC